ncbi:MAG: proline racemase family protein [candidate division Zixibacteria bacterium]|nr:proline racemase family protein [candidate division Zixibacteria bacterium]
MKDFRNSIKRWTPPSNWLQVNTIDAHAEGEPLRIIISGYPDLPGETILARRKYAKQHLDYIRTALMWEPRGHADMYGCLITPAVTEQADIGILFMHNEGYSSMCGHGIIAIAKVVLDTGMMEIKEPETTVRIDTPAGLVTAYARIENRKVTSVYFRNVPSFVVALDETIEVPDLGKIHYDLAYGGAFYAYVQAADVGLSCAPDNQTRLIEKGMLIKRAIMKSRKIIHPFEKDLNFLYGTIFIGPPVTEDADSRNVCVFAEGEVDRSPTGTGVSGRLAIYHARGEVSIGESIAIESIIGSKFTGRVVGETEFGPYKAIIPEVEGRAYITGRHEFMIDPDDPLRNGFIIR